MATSFRSIATSAVLVLLFCIAVPFAPFVLDQLA
jgi:hypothetical protein